jgi:hypothetical protein
MYGFSSLISLMARVAARVSDKRVLKLIRAFLNVWVMEDGLVRPVDEGTPQGGPFSPILSNLVLDDLDKELARRGHRFCRYADDCNIHVRSRRAGERGRTRLPSSVSLGLEGRHDGPNFFLRVGNKRAWSRVLTPSECRWLTQPDLVAGPGLFIGAANAIGRCDSMGLGETMSEVRRSQQGPTASSRRRRARLGEGLRIELDWLVSLLRPAGAVTEERARAQIQATPARSSVDK